MLPDEQAIQLHHRASLGEQLTPDEQAALEAWYTKQDAEEAAMLARVERRPSGKYRLLNGREVFLTHLSITPTYEGLIEGSFERASKHVLGHIPERVQGILRPGKPLVILPPPAMPLSNFLWVVRLESRSGVRSKDPDFNSFLFVCWFANELNRPIDAVVKEALLHADWESNAEDYDITIF